MKLLILSDLHLELWQQDDAFDDEVRRAADQVDVVILAGDIGTKGRGWEWAMRIFEFSKPFIYLAGNHEAYGSALDKELGHLLLQTTEHVLLGRPAHFLENASVDIGGVRFLGCTLWTDLRIFGDPLPLIAHEVEQGMNDYRVIRVASSNYRTLRAADTVARHRDSVAWLTEELAKDPEIRKVVVTHHLPSLRSVPERYQGHRLTPAYVSNLEHLMPQAAIWIHGHTHDAADYVLHGCRVVCNPRGYRTRDGGPENAQFCMKVVDV
jgi:predicted phosphodiesterase